MVAARRAPSLAGDFVPRRVPQFALVSRTGVVRQRASSSMRGRAHALLGDSPEWEPCLARGPQLVRMQEIASSV